MKLMYISLNQQIVFLKTCKAIIRIFIILYDILEILKSLPIPLEKDHFMIIVESNTNHRFESYILYFWRSRNTSVK